MSGVTSGSCARHHFKHWWQLVDGRFTPTPGGQGPVEPPPGRGPHSERIQNAIDGLAELVGTTPTLSALAAAAWNGVPDDYLAFCPSDFLSMVTWLNATLATGPQFISEAPDFVGVPITTTVLCVLHSHSGPYSRTY